jgi:hypothetical protein
VTHTAVHASTPPAADPAFAAVIFDMDGVVTNTAGLHAAAAAKCGWHEGIHLGGAGTMTTTSDH